MKPICSISLLALKDYEIVLVASKKPLIFMEGEIKVLSNKMLSKLIAL
jgi:hypothetical protein